MPPMSQCLSPQVASPNAAVPSGGGEQDWLDDAETMVASPKVKAAGSARKEAAGSHDGMKKSSKWRKDKAQDKAPERTTGAADVSSALARDRSPQSPRGRVARVQRCAQHRHLPTVPAALLYASLPVLSTVWANAGACRAEGASPQRDANAPKVCWRHELTQH